jgi:peptidoglycan biosynthesis protein MviN/MurJ (putative lipid II flippase)
MLLKAGVLSLALLLASRLLGLVRESALAAAFGTTGLADVAVLLLTLPDWITSVLASGALAYVLLPHWAGQAPGQHAVTQRRVARGLLLWGVAAALMLYLFRASISGLFVSGLSAPLLRSAAQAVTWSAVALPGALLAALWTTRLQYERDFTGMYSANLVINSVLIAGLYYAALYPASTDQVEALGLALVAATGLRLLWLRHRLHASVGPQDVKTAPSQSTSANLPLPRASVWTWAALASGLPLTLPFVARSFASTTGEGALATFNYAWKLVELPLVLAIQLAATLTFPAMASAMAQQRDQAVDVDWSRPAEQAIRSACMLTWTLACAAVAALQVGAPAIAGLLFGWGRMSAEGLAAVAAWGRAGSWSLLPQALIAVALSVLAAQGRMRWAVAAYSVALAVLLLVGSRAQGNGAWLMAALDALLTGVALVLLGVLRGSRGIGRLLPLKPMAVPTVVLFGLWFASQGFGTWLSASTEAAAVAFSLLAAVTVIAAALVGSVELRRSLRR